MPRLFRRATIAQLAAGGRTAKVLKALEPRRDDFATTREGLAVDFGAERRAEAATHLADVEGDEVTQALVERLTDPAEAVRLAALRSLTGRPGRREAEMVAAVLGWPEAGVRDDGAELLQERADGGDAAADRIVMAYADSAEACLSDEWVSSLLGAIDGPLRDVVDHAATRALADAEPDPCPRQVLTQAGRESAAVLLPRLDGDQDKLRVARLLGDLQDPTATGRLVEMLDRVDPRERRAAAEALGRVKDARAVEALLRRATDPNFEVRDAAQRALDALGTAGVVWSVMAAAQGGLDNAAAIEGTGEPRRLDRGPQSRD